MNGIYRGLLDGAGVTLFESTATLVDEHTLNVDGREVSAEYILIATGRTILTGNIGYRIVI